MSELPSPAPPTATRPIAGGAIAGTCLALAPAARQAIDLGAVLVTLALVLFLARSARG